MKATNHLKSKEKKYHHGDLRNALIKAGMEILEEEGLQGLSLRTIAARAGVSHTAPKNHFGSLRGLLTAIGAEGFRLHAREMQEGVSGASPGPERLTAAIRGYVNFAERHPALFSMMFSPLYCDFEDETLGAEARKSYAVLEDIATGLDWDKGALPHGQLRTEMMLWSLAHGFATLRLAGQFRDGDFGVPRFGPEDVIPDFGYMDVKGH
jgi:AcrR family transcriptional regulator